ncbi:hypothetical protein GCM10010421_16580 [Streptomyces glaucus]|uniref:Secreted protein n=1 Tax=Streptomyces glaucus TaxID=284029 RepID=A0ABN3JIL9_9ACTN
MSVPGAPAWELKRGPRAAWAGAEDGGRRAGEGPGVFWFPGSGVIVVTEVVLVARWCSVPVRA